MDASCLVSPKAVSFSTKIISSMRVPLSGCVTVHHAISNPAVSHIFSSVLQEHYTRREWVCQLEIHEEIEKKNRKASACCIFPANGRSRKAIGRLPVLSYKKNGPAAQTLRQSRRKLLQNPFPEGIRFIRSVPPPAAATGIWPGCRSPGAGRSESQCNTEACTA